MSGSWQPKRCVGATLEETQIALSLSGRQICGDEADVNNDRIGCSMQDEDKTKDQLIEELRDLRRQIATLCGRPDATASPEQGERSERRPTQTPIEFVANFELAHAQGVDVSASGICFETSEDLEFELEFEVDGETHQHTAHLAWMRKVPSGNSRWGFELVSRETSGLLSVRKLLETPEIEMDCEE
jgi:hypothetical protein